MAEQIRKRHRDASNSATEGEDNGSGAGTPCRETGPPLSTEAEPEQPAAIKAVPERQEAADPLLVKYGTTLLAVLATTEWLLYLQLGDGDILVVRDDGQVERPLGKDLRLLGGETTSLCTTDAWKDMRAVLRPIAEEAPALVLLSTDGYANSFSSDGDFLKTGPDYLRLIREEGWEYVQANLESWLTETSQLGSGDDIAVGILYRHIEGSEPARACSGDGESESSTC